MVCEYQNVLSANEHMEYYTYVKFHLKNKRGWWNENYLHEAFSWHYYYQGFWHFTLCQDRRTFVLYLMTGKILAVLLWPKALWKLLKTCHFHLGWFSSSFFWMTRPWVWRGSCTSWFEMYAIASWLMKIGQLYTTWTTPF